MQNSFLVWLKVIKLNPETQRAYEAPCAIEPQFCVNMDCYGETVARDTDGLTMFVFRNSLEEVLKMFFEHFQCPIGWMVEMQTAVMDLNIIVDDDNGGATFGFGEPEIKRSAEFCYFPPNQAEIDVEFVSDWVLAPYRTAQDSNNA